MTHSPFRRLKSLIGSLALLALPGLAQAECTGGTLSDILSDEALAELDARVAATPYAEGLLWEATRGADRLILIGTMHLADPRLDAVAERVIPYLDGAEHLLVEATDAEVAEIQQLVVNDPGIMFYTEGPSLRDRLSDEAWERVTEAAARYDIPPFLAAKYRPWALMMTMSVPPCAYGALASGGSGLDHMLMAEAEQMGIPASALEPAETLLGIAANFPDDEQIAYLELGLAPEDIQTRTMVELLQDYFAGRVARTWHMSFVMGELLPELGDMDWDAVIGEVGAVLLDGRNRAWIPVIEARMAEHDYVVFAAGAAHLPGEAGVLNLLAREGWTITRLP